MSMASCTAKQQQHARRASGSFQRSPSWCIAYSAQRRAVPLGMK